MEKENVLQEIVALGEVSASEYNNNKVAIYITKRGNIYHNICMVLALQMGFNVDQICEFVETDFSDELEFSTVCFITQP
ncbi:hypothetical protein MOE15_05470 [Bacillus atrophaeus]|uniref:hypothetical protein n=1 Tax=Bacillus atrophaeus TaxID=1452 RepID=UPI0022800D71|nr:hypothetical protein [Bacillus atrophaeus]MCY8807972.1 hypothetical protein [Bacillus atrophaeus]